jgi:hypothetical protein
MAMKFLCETLRNLPKFGFLVWKYTIWQPWARDNERVLGSNYFSRKVTFGTITEVIICRDECWHSIVKKVKKIEDWRSTLGKYLQHVYIYTYSIDSVFSDM